MTAKELRAFPGFVEMCKSDPFRVLLAYFMEECPHVNAPVADPTGIVRNEGKMQGWFGLLTEMRTIHKSPPEPAKEKGPRPLYADPDPRKSETNKP